MPQDTGASRIIPDRVLHPCQELLADASLNLCSVRSLHRTMKVCSQCSHVLRQFTALGKKKFLTLLMCLDRSCLGKTRTRSRLNACLVAYSGTDVSARA